MILGLTYFLLATQWWKFEKTWELLPQAALRCLPDAGHLAFFERPSAFVAVLQEFLAAL